MEDAYRNRERGSGRRHNLGLGLGFKSFREGEEKRERGREKGRRKGKERGGSWGKRESEERD